MRGHLVGARRAWLKLALVIPALLACGTSSTVLGGSGGGTPAPTPTHTPIHAPLHAIAWAQQDTTGIPQIWASVNDGPPTQITHETGSPADCGALIFGAPMFSPDLRHIAVADGGTCGDGIVSGSLYVVDASTGAKAKVPLPGGGSVRTNTRSYGWIDNNTMFAVGYFGSGPGGVTYTLGAGAATALPGLPSNLTDAVARGSTLFYAQEVDSTVAGGYPQYHTYLHRYNLTTHAVLPGSIDQGAFDMCMCSPGDFHLPGWDVSADGAHVVYQSVTPQTPTGSSTGIASQAIYYANVDGSGRTQIVQYMVTHRAVRMRLSPDGHLVGITEAADTPDVLSGCVNSPGLHGDPCLQFYSPDAFAYPAWHWDGAWMVATTTPPAADWAKMGILYQYTPTHFTGTMFAASGYSPWSTP